MNKYILLALAIPACSSISKETYTEQRTLTYPKGGHPYIKDMYLRNDNSGEVATKGVNPINNNNVMVAPAAPAYAGEDSIYTNPDMPVPHKTSEQSYEDIQDENRILLAKFYNKYLRM